MPQATPPLINRTAAIVGALLSALSVVYATSLLTALLGAVVFFAFYRRLGPAPTAQGSQPAPPSPFKTRSRSGNRAA